MKLASALAVSILVLSTSAWEEHPRSSPRKTDCQLNEDGSFGKEGPVSHVVTFSYQLEIDPTQDIDAILGVLERKFLGQLLQGLFGENCQGPSTARLPKPRNYWTEAPVGASIEPRDQIIKGENCQSLVRNMDDCVVVAGSMTIFTLDDQDYDDFLLPIIEKMMNQGIFNDAHPSIVQVSYVSDTASASESTGVENPALFSILAIVPLALVGAGLVWWRKRQVHDKCASDSRPESAPRSCQQNSTTGRSANKSPEHDTAIKRELSMNRLSKQNTSNKKAIEITTEWDIPPEPPVLRMRLSTFQHHSSNEGCDVRSSNDGLSSNALDPSSESTASSTQDDERYPSHYSPNEGHRSHLSENSLEDGSSSVESDAVSVTKSSPSPQRCGFCQSKHLLSEGCDFCQSQILLEEGMLSTESDTDTSSEEFNYYQSHHLIIEECDFYRYPDLYEENIITPESTESSKRITPSSLQQSIDGMYCDLLEEGQGAPVQEEDSCPFDESFQE